jgi:hypothetical protein
MSEIARLLGGTSILLLVAALATWSNLFRTPILKPIRGRTRLSSARAELASQFLVAATGLSAIAAVLAVANWMFA